MSLSREYECHWDPFLQPPPVVEGVAPLPQHIAGIMQRKYSDPASQSVTDDCRKRIGTDFFDHTLYPHQRTAVQFLQTPQNPKTPKPQNPKTPMGAQLVIEEI